MTQFLILAAFFSIGNFLVAVVQWEGHWKLALAFGAIMGPLSAGIAVAALSFTP